MRAALALLLALAAVVPALPAAAQVADAEQAGDQLSTDFYEGRTDGIWDRMTPQMQSALRSRENLAAFREQIRQQLGVETEVLERTVSSAQGHTVYLRRARFEKLPMVVLVQWAFDAEGKVGGFFIRPEQSEPPAPAPSKYLDYQTRADLRLPFEDEFFVVWGGRSLEQNRHAADANQRFALDLVILRDGATHAGDGRSNEDYHCFGRPVLAPATGTVVEALDGVEDNVPGETNREQLTGNRVILDHGNGEFSVLAHFRKGSLQVKAGDSVAAGQQLGECGNSGNSSEPHIHYQLQDGPRFGEAAGLPAQFRNYRADGEVVARGEPAKGQHIRPAAPGG